MNVNQQNYRSSQEYREILRILQKATTHQENILWQSHALGKNIIPLSHFEIDFVAREIVVHFGLERFKVDPELPLYIKLDYRTTVFKVEDYKVVRNSIHFPFPAEIKTLELRGLPRHRFSHSLDKYIGIKSSIPAQIQRDATSELNMRVIDISAFGVGLLVSEQNRSFLKYNRLIWLTRLQDDYLHEPILGEVVYINTEVDMKYQHKRQKDLKVGVKLSHMFPDDAYHRFLI